MTSNRSADQEDELDEEARLRRAGLPPDRATWTVDHYRVLVREHMAMAHEAEQEVASLCREMNARFPDAPRSW